MSAFDPFALGGHVEEPAPKTDYLQGWPDDKLRIDELYGEYEQLDAFLNGLQHDFSDAADKMVAHWHDRQGQIETEILGRVARDKAELTAQLRFLSLYLVQCENQDSYTEPLIHKLIAGVAILREKEDVA